MNERTPKLHKLRTLHLFAGAGGGLLADILLGHHPVCAVEIDPYCQQVLSARQKDGCLPWFPIFGDVKTFDGKPWRGLVDVVAGGFPCQDISAAGRGKGITGERSGLWSEMARVIGEIQPRFAFVENSPLLVQRGLGVVLSDFAKMGYDARWGIMGADNVGAPHRRKRIWILANSRHQQGGGRQKPISTKSAPIVGCSKVVNANEPRLEWSNNDKESSKRIQAMSGESGQISDPISERRPGSRAHWFGGDPAENCEGETDHAFSERLKRSWGIESRLGRVAHGVANRANRLRAIGNGQVPSVAALSWRTLIL